MLSHDFHLYGLGAAKLGRTLRRHSNLDMIMLELITRPIPQDTRITLRRAGWTTCKVSKIPGPSHVATDANRFLQAYIYSKFHAWQLIEYSAIALLDLDMLATKDPSDLFTTQLPLMLHENKTIGAVRDHPFQRCYFMGPWNAFNAGLLLIAPSINTYTVLVDSINGLQHNSAFDAEQALINLLFKDVFFELPVRYNANTVIKACEPALWLEHHDNFRLVHYTVSKPWTYSMRWNTLEDPFACWFWHVEDYCMLWDMIDAQAGI
jgi:lipopolysaccharide biosynthesis glycosyltransferase